MRYAELEEMVQTRAGEYGHDLVKVELPSVRYVFVYGGLPHTLRDFGGRLMASIRTGASGQSIRLWYTRRTPQWEKAISIMHELGHVHQQVDLGPAFAATYARDTVRLEREAWDWARRTAREWGWSWGGREDAFAAKCLDSYR